VSHWEKHARDDVWTFYDDEGIERRHVFKVAPTGEHRYPHFEVDQEGRAFATLEEAKRAAEAMPDGR
jgi:hypothetical protein